MGSAAALTYDLNRPLQWKDATSQPTSAGAPDPALAAVVPQAAPATVAPPDEATLQVPTVTIVGRIPPRSVAAPAPTTRDISEMRCTQWRELDMGSGHVQVCE